MTKYEQARKNMWRLVKANSTAKRARRISYWSRRITKVATYHEPRQTK